ncbi:MAG: hypothetical protein LBR76_06915 [Oscillospiraceae bacterium]|nr:hypothetical protein [Oscillospiraceae bacterium]
MLRQTGGEITEEGLERFLKERREPLSEQELWLFVPFLKTAVIGQIAVSCGEIDKILLAYGKTAGDSPFTAEARAFSARLAGQMPDRETEEFAAAAEGTHRRAATRIGTLITSLRLLSTADLTDILRASGAMEAALNRDAVYPQMDEETRGRYRAKLAKLARKERIGEGEAAERALALCGRGTTEKERHVGYYLWERPLGKKPPRWPGRLYFAALFALTLLPGAVCVLLTGRVWPGLLLLLPLSAMAKNIADSAATRLAPCRPVPRLELPDGLPENGKTLCVISALLTGAQTGGELAKKLESYRYANRDAGENLLFGLLVDFPDARQKERLSGEQALNETREAVCALNRHHGGGFFLFTRERVYNAREKKYMAWERKRGALLELCRLLRGKPGGLRADAGDETALRGVRYVITLDSDTCLTPGSARQMAGAMLHPLARPVIDPKKKIVTEGYGVIAPRMTVDLEAAGRTAFSRVFAGQGGLDPYCGMTGEVYHDLFGKGSFHGKGIFDVDCYLQCLDGRFPENRILSHDLLEGNYLRAGLMEDVELSDGFPATARAWFLRRERWIRGDWQVASWTLPRVPSPRGAERNPTGALERWKLLDTLRGSLVPAATLAALTAGTLFPGRIFAVTLTAALISSSSHLLLTLAEKASRPATARARTHAAIVTGIPAVAYQTLLTLAFLPYNAVSSAYAAVLALWRVCVTKKRLLQWVTSAETESVFAGAVQTARNMFPGLAWGVLTACLSRSAVGWVLGAGWAASPFIAYAVSRAAKPGSGLSDADRAFLSRQAALMWRYFEDFLTPEDHYLIPDNFQEQPAAGAAHRTSPTNVGLSMLCALAAADLGLCSRERSAALLDSILTAIEAIPKWHGHLLNWYDTRTLEPLTPRCVSSVDSGNLCGCLIALREGLAELGEASLAKRAGALADGMDFTPLYDAKRKFFRISVDLDRPEAGAGVYDLLASEARQTSYIAVARGEADKKHWQRLGRAQVEVGSYRGMASWTGTMFEYFMPHLLLPAYRNSLIRESLDFAVFAQRLYGSRRGIPWGVSESCFYAFDRALNYQYKAHGVPALAYKRGLGADRVIAPYASFLSLLTHPTASVRNLRWLHRMGLEGQYGLIEAIDYTPSRVSPVSEGAGGRHEEVRCYMSHHLGMSLAAVCNALRDNILQKRFMRNGAMGAFAGLLQERVPVGAATVKPFGREVPEKPKRAEAGYQLELEHIRAGRPRVTLLSNRSYTVLCADSGMTRSEWGGAAVTRFEPGRGGGGMSFAFNGESLLPDGADTGGFTASFEGSRAVWRGRRGTVQSEVSVSVPDNENAETRAVTLFNTGKEAVRGVLSCYFEPVLQRGEDYEAHPAFSKLFIDARTEGGFCLVRRRPRTGKREVWLAFATDGEGTAFETSRETAVGRGRIPKLNPENNAGSGLKEGGNSEQAPPVDPCVFAAARITVPAGEKVTVRYALAIAPTAADASAAAKRTLKRSAVSALPDEAARSLGMTAAERSEAFDWLARMVFPQSAGNGEGLTLGREGLWAVGISGDLPLIVSPADGTPEKAARAIRQHRYLSLCGFSCDLALLTRDGSEYHRPARSFLMEVLKACRAEHTAGKKGGVHIIDLGTLNAEQEGLLHSFAAVLTDAPDSIIPDAAEPEPRERPPEPGCAEREPLRYRWNGDNSFSFTVRGELPPLGWSHTLANPNFGALVTETGAGYTWRKNARENKMTPWTNDPLATVGGVTLTVNIGGREVSLFAAEDGMPCGVTYGFGFARWEKQTEAGRVTATQFVPPDRMALVTLIEAEAPISVTYGAELVMGVSQGRFCAARREEDGTVRVRNPFNKDYAPQEFIVAATGGLDAAPQSFGRVDARFNTISDSCPSQIQEENSGQPTLSDSLSFAEAKETAVLVTGCACNERGAALLRELTGIDAARNSLRRTREHWEALVRPVRVNSGREALDHYGNGWGLYQVIAVRLCARTSLYQCGGAYGFRDQLQDVCAALTAEPRLAKTQILRACARQYEEGDVMHWWHPANRTPGFSDKGVRTKCSDDLLWLPYTVAEYCEKTGDDDILSAELPYLVSPPLEKEDDRYETPAVSARRGSVYEHCLRAFERVAERGSGKRGLLLIGGGDWNDGMNLVGHKGAGESVWLTWFAAHTAERFSPLCERRGDGENAKKLSAWSERLVNAASEAWDGRWFLRGTYDDGTELGSAKSGECEIDSIAQSFSALFPGRVLEERVREALRSAAERLVDRGAKLVKLFAPAFSGRGAKDPGYIKGYVPGVRENGGQYTHAAVWLAMAFAKAGDRETCLDLLEMLLPETHDNAVYKAEPHVLAADVYSHPAHLGRGGWSHYTGAAGWFYRVLTEVLES